MDESNGYFRLATTEDSNLNGEQSNSVYILNLALKTVGKLTGIAPGEKLYSARFMGDRAYLVSFRYIDPLFVIELTDPTSPRKLGELKVPGYSDYLQPYDETHIIGFGQDVTPPSDPDAPITPTAVKGMKIGMFDVTDPNKPKEMFKETIGDQGTTSEVLYNHKALLFDKNKNLLAFPISVSTAPDDKQQCGSFTYSKCPTGCSKVCVPSSCTLSGGVKVCTTDCEGADSCQQTYSYPKTTFVGAYVYNVSLANGFQLKAKITHLNTQDQTDLTTNGWLTDYDKTIQRVLYIGDTLYTVSQEMVKANSLSDFSEKNSTVISGTTYNYPMPVMEPPQPMMIQ